MVKLYRIPGTDVKIQFKQDGLYCVDVMFAHDGTTTLGPGHPVDAEMIRALGFPTEKTEPKPIDGGDLEEVTE